MFFVFSSFVTLQTLANIEHNIKQEKKEIIKQKEKQQKVEYQMSECNHGNAFKLESVSKAKRAEKAEAKRQSELETVGE